MSFYLLSWHGTLAGYTGMSMHPASFVEVLSHAMTPVILHAPNQLEPFGTFIQVQPVETATSLVALKAGTHYISSRDTEHFGTQPHCAEWEHFLAIPLEILTVLHDLTTHTWYEDTRFLGTARCGDHEIHLQDRKWSIRGLHAERNGDTLTLWTDTAPERTDLQVCPSSKLTSLIKALAEQLETADIDPATTPWADLDDLRGQILLVTLNPENTGHILYLSRLCGLFEFWDLAKGFLACAQTQDERPDLFWFAAILALCSNDYPAAASLLEQAFETKFPHQDVLQKTQSLLTALKAGENIFPLLPRHMHHRNLPAFDGLFDALLVPMPLSHNCDHPIKQAYSVQFEEICAVQDIPHRIRMVNTELRMNGESYWEEINRGHIGWLTRQRAKADIHYKKARTLAIQSQLLPVHYNSGVFTWLAEADSAALITHPVPDQMGLSSWTWRFSPHADKRPELCLVFGSDSRYFVFLPKLIFSLIKACRTNPNYGRIELCIGVNQPTPKQLSFLTTVAEWLEKHAPGLGLTFTHGQLTSQNPTTYTTIRYLMLPEITARYHCPVITADCDGYFPEEFINLWHEMRETTDYGFRLYAYDKSGRQLNGEPWGFGAGISYFGDPEKLPEIGNFLSNYLNTAYNPENPTNWCVDQCALAEAFQLFVAPHWDALRIKFMDDGPSLMVMPHHVGGKKELLAHEGAVSQEDVLQDLLAHTPA